MADEVEVDFFGTFFFSGNWASFYMEVEVEVAGGCWRMLENGGWRMLELGFSPPCVFFLP